MPFYKMIVAYDGTRFHGFQRQIDNTAMKARSEKEVAACRPKKRPHYTDTGTRKGCNITVQEVLELLLLDLYPDTTVDEICLKFSGRTDKGVHARGQVCVVRLPLPLQVQTCWKLRKDVNSRLPVDVSVQNVSYLGAESSFDPRRDVKRKRYSFTIKFRRKDSNFPDTLAGPHTIRHAFDPPCRWVCPWSLDDSMLSKLCQQLAGTHNYSNFVHKADRGKKDQNLTVDRMEFEIIQLQEESYLASMTATKNEESNELMTIVVTGRFVFEAGGFRRTMLRNLVGYCVDVCRGLPGVAPVEQVFDDDADVAASINAAPAVGLCLESVTY